MPRETKTQRWGQAQHRMCRGAGGEGVEQRSGMIRCTRELGFSGCCAQNVPGVRVGWRGQDGGRETGFQVGGSCVSNPGESERWLRLCGRGRGGESGWILDAVWKEAPGLSCAEKRPGCPRASEPSPWKGGVACHQGGKAVGRGCGGRAGALL